VEIGCKGANLLLSIQLVTLAEGVVRHRADFQKTQRKREKTMENGEQIYDKFLEEYGSDDAVRKYTAGTAGFGINYLLCHDYAKVYLSAVGSHLQTSPPRPLRLLEFGCGGGMNIVSLVSLLEEKGIPVECAYGTDFSPRLVQSATQEAKASLTPSLAKKLSFYVARNERLAEDLAVARFKPVDDLVGFFDLIVGVNTFRYCHRLGKEQECAADIYRLLRPGGVCVNIDMNNRFPAFRSKLKRSVEDPTECYVPTLEEYASPFKAAGFEITRKENFCWIPHSAGRALTISCLLLSPLFNLMTPSRAMRSLVVARKAT
jgi:SAM-dependent methyltransferase